MNLYHRTDAGPEIMRAGFKISHVRDSQGGSWLCADRNDLPTHGAWVVIVELPDDQVEQYRYPLDDDRFYLSNVFVPFEVLNERMPFTLERY